MKKFLFILLTIVSLTTYSQESYPPPKPWVYSPAWNTSNKFNSTKANLKHGVGDLITANNFTYFGVGFSMLGAQQLNKAILNSGDPGNVFRGAIFSMAGVSFIVASHIHTRRGLKRIYWGIDGITIPLNQE